MATEAQTCTIGILANPACRGAASGEVGSRTGPAQTAYPAQFAKELCPLLCKTNPIFLRIKLMQRSLPQRIMKMNHASGLWENKPNQTQFQRQKRIIKGDKK